MNINYYYNSSKRRGDSPMVSHTHQEHLEKRGYSGEILDLAVTLHDITLLYICVCK